MRPFALLFLLFLSLPALADNHLQHYRFPEIEGLQFLSSQKLEGQLIGVYARPSDSCHLVITLRESSEGLANSRGWERGKRRFKGEEIKRNVRITAYRRWICPG